MRRWHDGGAPARGSGDGGDGAAADHHHHTAQRRSRNRAFFTPLLLLDCACSGSGERWGAEGAAARTNRALGASLLHRARCVPFCPPVANDVMRSHVKSTEPRMLIPDRLSDHAQLRPRDNGKFEDRLLKSVSRRQVLLVPTMRDVSVEMTQGVER